VFAEFVGRGTHTGPLVGPAGTLPPTGRSIEFPVGEPMRVEGACSPSYTSTTTVPPCSAPAWRLPSPAGSGSPHPHLSSKEVVLQGTREAQTGRYCSAKFAECPFYALR
jgi:hypothetical protein